MSIYFNTIGIRKYAIYNIGNTIPWAYSAMTVITKTRKSTRG